jgi:hypothetical protein
MGVGIRYQVKEINGQQLVEELHIVVVHRFRLSDVDDPDIYVAEPLWNWQQSEQGKFIMKHSVIQPEWHKQIDTAFYGYQIAIVAELEKKKLAEFYLRWGKVDGNR